ncbi:MAG: rubrerythrin family protein [Christensenellales bacterium]|jgi:rubrerythrin
MDLNGSNTLQNLARAFAGESQAATRYHFYQKAAQQDGHQTIATIIQEIIRNELAHGKVFFDHIIKGGLRAEQLKNIIIGAGYPFQMGASADNLLFSMQAEQEEHANIYPNFAQTAKQEGFAAVAASFEMIAQIEGLHQNIFQQMHEQLTQNTLYQKEQAVSFKCAECGHVRQSKDAWSICPVCHYPQGFVELDIQLK